MLTYILSLVGLYYFTQHYLSKRIKTLSIYRAIGFKNSFLFYISTAQLFLLTLISVAVAIMLVLTFLPMIQTYFSYLISEQLIFVLTMESIIRILIISLAGNVLALIPLFWGAMQTPVSIVFQDLPAELKRINYKFFIPLYFYIVLLSVLLSHSVKVGVAFVLLCTFIIFMVAALFRLATYFLEKYSRRFSFVNKHSARTLSRYFSSSFTVDY